MGILNITPDSFSDGGRFASAEVAVAAALQMVADGAAIIDVGGESTRPGARPVQPDEELRRVLPVIGALRLASDVLISVDTTKASVARVALEAGADMINDVSGMTWDAEMPRLCAETSCGCVAMFTPARPAEMDAHALYSDVVRDVGRALEAHVGRLVGAGVDRAAIAIDPGFGFGKTVSHNYALVARLHAIAPTDLPLVAGVSRKRMIREVVGPSIAAVEHGTTAAHVACVLNGARVLRTHDPVAARAAIAVVAALGAAHLGA